MTRGLFVLLFLLVVGGCAPNPAYWPKTHGLTHEEFQAVKAGHRAVPVTGSPVAAVQPRVVIDKGPVGAFRFTNLTDLSHMLADRMINLNAGGVVHPSLRHDPAEPIIVTSFVNLDNLEQSSPFGRLIAEQMASRIVQRGWVISDIKIADSVLMAARRGEFILTRKVKRGLKAKKAAAVLVGQYSVNESHLFLVTQLVRIHDNRILSAANLDLPLSRKVRKILGLETTPTIHIVDRSSIAGRRTAVDPVQHRRKTAVIPFYKSVTAGDEKAPGVAK